MEAPHPPPTRKPRRGDTLEVRLEDYDERGRPAGRAGEEGEYEFALRRTRGVSLIPGSRVRAEVRKRRGSRLEGVALEQLSVGPDHRAPRCEHFGTCGGCSYQDLAYSAQLAHKARRIRAQLAAFPELADVVVEEPLGCEEPWSYRNKMDFTFSNRRFVEVDEPEGAESDFALGLHAPGRYEKVMDVRGCPIQFEGGDAILTSAREVARARGLAPWDVRKHEGLLRHVVLRRAWATGEILVNLVTSSEAPELVLPYVDELRARHPEVTTWVQNINTRVAAIAVGERELVLHGPGVIEEELGGLRFTISAGSFFQTNTPQAERLFELVREAARLDGDEVLFDLYCGAGTIGLLLARSVREVHGFEQVESAVQDARANAARNGVENAVFEQGDVLELSHPDHLAARGLPSPDLVVVDPPRAGLHPKVVGHLLALAPRRLIYVSCNPRTAAPDLATLVAEGYALERARPVDLFPHTPHVECVFALERRGA